MPKTKTKPKPKSRTRRDEENNPFINTFNALKGIYYPSRTKRLIRKTNHKESQIKSIRERVLERMKEPKEFSHPYEKKFRKSRKKYVAPISTILTRSMKRSQEFPFTGLDALVEETIKSQRPKPSKRRSKTANVSL